VIPAAGAPGTASNGYRVRQETCDAAIQLRFTVRTCDLPAGHDDFHVTNDGEGRPEYYWRVR
jgi:hypothetical protein